MEISGFQERDVLILYLLFADDVLGAPSELRLCFRSRLMPLPLFYLFIFLKCFTSGLLSNYWPVSFQDLDSQPSHNSLYTVGDR